MYPSSRSDFSRTSSTCTLPCASSCSSSASSIGSSFSVSGTSSDVARELEEPDGTQPARGLGGLALVGGVDDDPLFRVEHEACARRERRSGDRNVEGPRDMSRGVQLRGADIEIVALPGSSSCSSWRARRRTALCSTRRPGRWSEGAEWRGTPLALMNSCTSPNSTLRSCVSRCRSSKSARGSSPHRRASPRRARVDLVGVRKLGRAVAANGTGLPHLRVPRWRGRVVLHRR